MTQLVSSPPPRCCTAAATDPDKHEDGADCAAALEKMIAAALAALKIPHADRPYNDWVNSGNRWTKAAHRARLALGAES